MKFIDHLVLPLLLLAVASPTLLALWDSFMWLIDAPLLQSWVDWTTLRQMGVVIWTVTVLGFISVSPS